MSALLPRVLSNLLSPGDQKKAFACLETRHLTTPLVILRNPFYMKAKGEPKPNPICLNPPKFRIVSTSNHGMESSHHLKLINHINHPLSSNSSHIQSIIFFLPFLWNRRRVESNNQKTVLFSLKMLKRRQHKKEIGFLFSRWFFVFACNCNPKFDAKNTHN